MATELEKVQNRARKLDDQLERQTRRYGKALEEMLRQARFVMAAAKNVKRLEQRRERCVGDVRRLVKASKQRSPRSPVSNGSETSLPTG